MMWKSLVILMVAVPAVFCACKLKRQVKAVKNIQINDLEGIWFNQYDQIKSEDSDELGETSCERLHFHVEDDGKMIDIMNSELPLGGKTSNGTAFYTNVRWAGGDGKFTMSAKIQGIKFELLYWVIGTDYKNFLITYVCARGVENASIMTRKKGPVSEELKNSIEEALSASNLKIDQFYAAGQEDCIH